MNMHLSSYLRKKNDGPSCVLFFILQSSLCMALSVLVRKSHLFLHGNSTAFRTNIVHIFRSLTLIQNRTEAGVSDGKGQNYSQN